MARNVQMIFQDPFSSLNPVKKIKQILKEPIVNLAKKSDISKSSKKKEINLIYSFLYDLINHLNISVIEYNEKNFNSLASLVNREVLFQANKIMLTQVQNLISNSEINTVKELEDYISKKDFNVSNKLIKSLKNKAISNEYLNFGIFYQEYKNKKKVMNQKIYEITKLDFQIKSLKRALRNSISARNELQKLAENSLDYRKKLFEEVMLMKKEIKVLRDEKSLERNNILRSNILEIKKSYETSLRNRKISGTISDFMISELNSIVETYYTDVEILTNEVSHLINVNKNKNIQETAENFDANKIMDS
jgi:ABC-type dipeptide/oligopeptide/nickel transport system ATPase component